MFELPGMWEEADFLGGETDTEIEDKLSLLETQLATYKEDLAFQLTFEEMDWNYFIDTAKETKVVQDKINKLKGND